MGLKTLTIEHLKDAKQALLESRLNQASNSLNYLIEKMNEAILKGRLEIHVYPNDMPSSIIELFISKGYSVSPYHDMCDKDIIAHYVVSWA